MKSRHQRKLFRLIREDDFPKLKSHIKKHKLDIEDANDEACEDSPLHVACACGHDVIAMYLLERGADPLQFNKSGDLPIHLACEYAQKTGRKFVYTDLVLPLVNQCPSSLEVPNSKGVTTREMLADMKRSLQGKYERSSSSCSGTESDDTSQHWSSRLEAEMADEYQETFGTYDEDYHYEGRKPDTYDNWADSMSSEYQRKRRGAFPVGGPSTSSKRKKKNTTNEQTERPKISEEKQKEFARKLHEEYRRINDLKRVKSVEDKVKSREEYDKKCKNVFSGKPPIKNFGFSDIPWPHDAGKDLPTIEDFLFCDLEKGSQNYKKYLKEQQVRWHPDRFQQKCGNYIKSKDREKVMDKVKEISQMLNSLSEKIS